MPLVDWISVIGDWADRLTAKPALPKKEDALRFGILGAANIGPMALIIPSRTHPEVNIVAVAARDKQKAEAYAKRHGIPIVHDNYDALVNDPSIDCIYNPLPNGLHYEWTIKALKAGKHVLLEKPSVSNGEEARSLFRHPLLSGPKAPVLLEAVHYRFHPAWRTFSSLFDPKDVEHVEARASVPPIFSGTDIRFLYDLSGGTMMDLGFYTASTMRGAFGVEPTSVTSATPRLMRPPFDTRCDEAIDATYTFPSGGTGHISADLAARGGWPFPWLTANWPNFWRDMPPWVSVKLREETHGLLNGLQSVSQRTITLKNFMGPHSWHAIDIETVATRRDESGKVVEKKTTKESKKAYTWPKEEDGGDKSWTTYRYQLEEFVNRILGRKGSGAWVSAEDSIKQMELLDKTYEKAGLALRPTSAVLNK